MSILNSWMFKSSGSPPLSLQKQQFQFERERERKRKKRQRERIKLQLRVFFFFSWPGKERHLWFECAWGSTVCFHFKPTWQTNSDRFVPLFSLLLLLTPSQIMGKTRCTSILVLLVVCMFSCSTGTRANAHTDTQLHTHTHTHTNTHTHLNKSEQNDANNRQL